MIEYKIRYDKVSKLKKEVRKITIAQFESPYLIKYALWKLSRNTIKLEIEAVFSKEKKIIYEIHSGIPEKVTDLNDDEKFIQIDKIVSTDQNCKITKLNSVYYVLWTFEQKEYQELSLKIITQTSASLQIEDEIKSIYFYC